MNSLVYRMAVILLKRGQPLPVDLETKLMIEGINPTSLKRRYGV